MGRQVVGRGQRVLYRGRAELLAMDAPGAEADGGAPASSAPPLRSPDGSLVGVLYVAAPGAPIGSPGGAAQASPGWAVGWYPEGPSRWLGVQEWVAQAKGITRIEVDGCRVRLDLGPGGVVELFVSDASRFGDTVGATPLGSLLSGPRAWGGCPPPDGGDVFLGSGPLDHPAPGFPRPASFPPPGDHGMPPGLFPPDYRPRRLRPKSIWSKVGLVVLTVSVVALRLLFYFYLSRDPSTNRDAVPTVPVLPAPLLVPDSTPTVVVAPTPTLGRPSGYTGPEYPGMITEDHAANSAGQVRTLGATATATNLRPVPPNFGGPLVCADVILVNMSSVSYFYGSFLWTVQDPNGRELGATFDGTMGSGQLAPGASVRGTVCFDRLVQKGTFVLLWAGESSHPGRGVWLLPLAPR